MNKNDRDSQLRAVIKSNLISFKIPVDNIEEITRELTNDVIDLFENYIEEVKDVD